MSEFFVGGRRFVVNRDLYAQTLGRQPINELMKDLVGLGELEKCKEIGLLSCTPEAWGEVIGMARDITFEIDWRTFTRSCGITMEVR